MTQPIFFIVRSNTADGASSRRGLYEIPNYQGYIPHIGDWIKFPTAIGMSCVKVVARDFTYENNQLMSVILWI